MVSDNRLALDFSYELDLWGKNRSRLKSAVSQQAAAAADAQAARNLLASAVVRAYLNLQNGFAQRSVLKRVLAQRADVLELTRRYSAGLDTQVEVKQAESSLAAGKVELTQVETTLAQLRNRRGAGRRRPARPVADRDGAGRAGRRRARQRAAGPAGPPSRRGGRALAPKPRVTPSTLPRPSSIRTST